MKILEVFEQKLRYKNYSDKTIKTYLSYLKQFIRTQNINDPYQVSTKQICEFLHTNKFTSISQQNQFIGCLKLFAKHILNKKDIHLSKIERPKSEKKLPKVIDGESIKSQLQKFQNLKHKTILTLTYSVGLRVSEVVNLKIEDIDSKRMLIHIKNAKGRKDNRYKLKVEGIYNHMKYIISESKLDNIVFRYLDNTLKNLEKRKSKYFKGYVFVYPNEEYGILGWKNDSTLYINKELIDEISNGFGMNKSDSESIIGRWASDRYQLEVNNTSRRAFMNWRLASDRLQLEVKNTLTPIRISQDDIQ